VVLSGSDLGLGNIVISKISLDSHTAETDVEEKSAGSLGLDASIFGTVSAGLSSLQWLWMGMSGQEEI